MKIATIAKLLIGLALPFGSETGVVIRVVDTGGKPVPCQIYLKDDAGKPIRAQGLPFWHDHFVSPGQAKVELLPGKYSYEIERGPEFPVQTGSFQVTEGALTNITVKLERLVDMSEKGWWSGDLHVHRPVSDAELLMQAADLHVAPIITWWNARNQWANQGPPARPLVQFDQNHYYHLLAGEDEREGGALLYFNLSKPLAITQASREFPSPMKFLAEARLHEGAWVDIEKPFWWDVPVWLASGQVDSVGLANNHMCRSGMSETEAWGKPRDTQRLPPPRGNGFWTQEIYYHILNSGLRVPPSAGSASGVLPNPVGYNRVYVHVGKNLSYREWWEGLRAGRSFVSNGPLLLCTANGNLPGHLFTTDHGKGLKIEIQASLHGRKSISSIEIIKDGRVERAIPSKSWKEMGALGSLTFSESGWFLVRAITDDPKTFRFVSTAPFYVEMGSAKRRISRSSVQFFLDWVRERAARVKLQDPDQMRQVLQHHAAAEKFWVERLATANAN
jgi:hypothetical protein